VGCEIKLVDFNFNSRDSDRALHLRSERVQVVTRKYMTTLDQIQRFPQQQVSAYALNLHNPYMAVGQYD